MASEGGYFNALSVNEMTQISETPGVVALLDNSNIWITGKQYAGQQKGLEEEDSSWRVNFEAIYKLVLRERKHALFRLFGSIPPPTDQVWERCEQGGFSVDLTYRSNVSKKEKRVDNKFQHVLLFEARAFKDMDLEERAEHRSYCIIGGDSDYSDAVKIALDQGHLVEVWSWSKSLNGRYKKLKCDYPNMKIAYFEYYFGEIGFPESMTMNQKLRMQSIRKDMTIVFVPSPALPFHELMPIVDKIYETMTVQAYMTPTKDGEVVFLFLHNRIKPDKMDYLIDYARKYVGQEHRNCVKSYAEFFSPAQEMNFDIDPRLMQDSQKKFLGKRAALAETSESGGEEGQKEEEDNVDSEGGGDGLEKARPSDDQVAESEEWRMANFRRNNQIKKREEQKVANERKVANAAGTQACNFREFCLVGTKCPYQHSDAELMLFRMHGGRSPFKLLKLKDCLKAQCKKQEKVRESCSFFHLGLEDKLCRLCLGIPCLAPSQCSANVRYNRQVLRENGEQHLELQRRGWMKRT
eukprot:TRINITY_DN26279_c0_g1_i1.p1 TRINITY_DN26279_c0_g1~~TRINITY_DN26279_c0_g1_i1.p1  ORF type:complete len:522 (+),score=83.02 TRINITY_DN26279_c0_g1_i1:119-1684(+)